MNPASNKRWQFRLLGVLLSLALLASSLISVASAHEPRKGPPDRYAVILVLDGARPGYFDLTRMPNLRWLISRGVTYTQAFTGQEEANTPPGHVTIGTGLFPRHSGVVGFEWEDPRTGLLDRPTDNATVVHGSLEQVFAAQHLRSLAGAVKQRYRRGKVLAASGHKCYAADAMASPQADYILCALIYHNRWVAQAVNRHLPPRGAVNNPRFDVPMPPFKDGPGARIQFWRVGSENHWAMRYALWTFQKSHHPRLMMINLPESDVMAHFIGKNSTIFSRMMRDFDKDLGRLIAAYRQAGILQRTTFLVTADHGMSRVHSRIPPSDIDTAVSMAGATKVYAETDTAAFIGIRENWKARLVALNLARLVGSRIDATYYKARSGTGWVYRLATVRRGIGQNLRHAYSTLLDTMASPEGPDVAAIYAPHVTTGDHPIRGFHWLAGHLGPQWDDQHIPFILAGAGVRTHAISSYPASLVDITPTLETLLGTRHTPTDGVVLADALQHSSSREQAAQASRARGLRPLVSALQQRSR